MCFGQPQRPKDQHSDFNPQSQGATLRTHPSGPHPSGPNTLRGPTLRGLGGEAQTWKKWGPEGRGPELLGPEGWVPEGCGPQTQTWAPKGGRPKISRFFFPWRPQSNSKWQWCIQRSNKFSEPQTLQTQRPKLGERWPDLWGPPFGKPPFGAPSLPLRGHTSSGFGFHPPFLAVLVLLWLLLWLLLVWTLLDHPAPDHPTPDRPKFRSFLPSLEFRDPQTCALSGCCVKPRGFTRQPENSKRAHFRALALQTPPKFHEKTPREKRSENGGGRGKKAKFLGSPAEGGPASGGQGPNQQNTNNNTTTHNTNHNTTTTQKLFGPSWIGPNWPNH